MQRVLKILSFVSWKGDNGWKEEILGKVQLGGWLFMYCYYRVTNRASKIIYSWFSTLWNSSVILFGKWDRNIERKDNLEEWLFIVRIN